MAPFFQYPVFAFHRYRFSNGLPFLEEYTSAGAFGGGIHVFLIAFFQYADRYATLINVISIPVFALFSFLLFHRSGYNYAEHLVLNAYITSRQLLLYIGRLPLTNVIPLPVDWMLGCLLL